MTYDITVTIEADSPEARKIEAVAEAEHVSREEAVLKLVANAPSPAPSDEKSGAWRLLGAFSSDEDSQLMDEVVEMAMEDRRRRNASLRDE